MTQQIHIYDNNGEINVTKASPDVGTIMAFTRMGGGYNVVNAQIYYISFQSGGVYASPNSSSPLVLNVLVGALTR